MDDYVPPTVEGSVLAIADKADTIAGMFALGMHPLRLRRTPSPCAAPPTASSGSWPSISCRSRLGQLLRMR